jgi:hypothetical protein
MDARTVNRRAKNVCVCVNNQLHQGDKLCIEVDNDSDDPKD